MYPSQTKNEINFILRAKSADEIQFEKLSVDLSMSDTISVWYYIFLQTLKGIYNLISLAISRQLFWIVFVVEFVSKTGLVIGMLEDNHERRCVYAVTRLYIFNTYMITVIFYLLTHRYKITHISVVLQQFKKIKTKTK